MAFRRRGRKRISHPELGLIDVNCLNLFSEDGRQRLLWFTPTPRHGQRRAARPV
ncbi:hypothetical protein ACO229_07205 [Promicromonospora sp. MS192]|uniref:hypothetical protein n=1 Tax=Promicromonospora sp. MS192 TaxID=3412684 RepID=UPI003C2B6C0E